MLQTDLVLTAAPHRTYFLVFTCEKRRSRGGACPSWANKHQSRGLNLSLVSPVRSAFAVLATWALMEQRRQKVTALSG